MSAYYFDSVPGAIGTAYCVLCDTDVLSSYVESRVAWAASRT